MSVPTRAKPVAEIFAGTPGGEMLLNVFPEGNTCVVYAKGELDLASRNQFFVASTAGNHPAMVIDLAGVTFMDCSGYGSLVASRLAIEGGGRKLTIRGRTGQPARLLGLIAAFERVGAAED